jgi:hypothetical protein
LKGRHFQRGRPDPARIAGKYVLPLRLVLQLVKPLFARNGERNGRKSALGSPDAIASFITHRRRRVEFWAPISSAPGSSAGPVRDLQKVTVLAL